MGPGMQATRLEPFREPFVEDRRGVRVSNAIDCRGDVQPLGEERSAQIRDLAGVVISLNPSTRPCLRANAAAVELLSDVHIDRRSSGGFATHPDENPARRSRARCMPRFLALWECCVVLR
jgi:hypothetical protein